MPTHVDTPAFGVPLQFRVGTVHWPLASVISALLDGITYPDQVEDCANEGEVGPGDGPGVAVSDLTRTVPNDEEKVLEPCRSSRRKVTT